MPLFWVGVATAATGAAVSGLTGLLALRAHDDVATKCPGGTCIDASGIDDATRARTMAWISTIALGVGLAGAALVVLAPSKKATRTAMSWRGLGLSF